MTKVTVHAFQATNLTIINLKNVTSLFWRKSIAHVKGSSRFNDTSTLEEPILPTEYRPLSRVGSKICCKGIKNHVACKEQATQGETYILL